MKAMLRTALVGVAMVTLAGCAAKTAMDEVPPNTSADWRVGWRDGCDSGRATGGAERYQYNYNLLGTGPYKAGWQDGFVTCREAGRAAGKPAKTAKG